MKKLTASIVAVVITFFSSEVAKTPSIELAPFKFVLTKIAVTSKGKLLLEDTFARPEREEVASQALPFRYLVNIGRVDDAAFKTEPGGLILDQANTEPTYNSFVTMVTVPFGGKHSIAAEQLNNSEISVTLKEPRITGNEKFRLGIIDNKSLHGIAVIGIGGTFGPHFPPGGGGGGGKLFLEREEWPEVQGEITLDSADLGDFTTIGQIDLTLRVGELGRYSGVGNVRRADGTEKSFTLTPNENKEPREFFAKRSRIDQSLTDVSVILYVEALPKPQIFVVSPSEIDMTTLTESSGSVSFRVHGTGFGVDTKVEVYAGRDPSVTPLKVVAMKQVRDGLLEVTAELAKTNLTRKQTFTVRVTSGGQSVSREAALQLVR
jgi:hypothetical protein